ncbi:unnamed protein product [Polarella glacialis]|uniref:Uncharacterized protein n=1 Tax=Polarella glacialis TaxID=89957 RepID=A0A813J8D7_POLGL|nr:unnamed protein product [Polarella glacialis]
MLRSHLAALTVPAGERSVGEASERILVFGGSRYFSGAYFHDLLELRRRERQRDVAVVSDGQEVQAEQPPLHRPVPAPSFYTRLTSLIQRDTPPQESVDNAPGENASGLPTGSSGERGRAGRLSAMSRDGLPIPATRIRSEDHRLRGPWTRR